MEKKIIKKKRGGGIRHAELLYYAVTGLDVLPQGLV